MSTGRDAGGDQIKQRSITEYPMAMFPDCTPYKSINFHPRVQESCRQASTRNINIKQIKAVVVGDVSVGKTCLIHRFAHEVFDHNYRATIGVDFEVEKFSVLSVPASLHLWDTAGQERFRCIAASYYRGANAVVVAFDISVLDTLRNARMWMDEACENVMMDDPVRFLVGCKSDLKSDVSLKEAEICARQVANELNAELWLTSAKSDEHVKEFFFRLMAIVFNKILLRQLESAPTQSKQIADAHIKVQPSRKGEKGLKSNVNCCK